MNIHEYQAKQMFRNAGVSVLDGLHCRNVGEAIDAYRKLGAGVVAVKSQIHAGGRGKGTLLDPKTSEVVMEGGVKIAFSEDEVRDYSDRILGNLLITKQTGKRQVGTNLYVESGCDIVHEYYLAMLVDRDSNSLLVMASREGGMDIEEVAETNPDSIHRITSSGKSGFDRDSCVDLGSKLGLIGPHLRNSLTWSQNWGLCSSNRTAA